MAANFRNLGLSESFSDCTSTADPVEQIFSKPGDMTDVIFIVEDKELHFNTVVLSICSPVFKAMFTGDLKEKVTKKIPLPGKKHEDMVAFFKELHPMYCKRTPITDESLQKILPLADEYQAKSVLDVCEDYIRQKMPDAETDVLTLYLVLCERHHLASNRAQLIELCVGRDSTKLEDTAYYKELPQELRQNILSQRCKKVETYVNTQVKTLVENLSKVDNRECRWSCDSDDSVMCKNCCMHKIPSALRPYP